MNRSAALRLGGLKRQLGKETPIYEVIKTRRLECLQTPAFLLSIYTSFKLFVSHSDKPLLPPRATLQQQPTSHHVSLTLYFDGSYIRQASKSYSYLMHRKA